jgi:hypothetical protein
MSTIAAPAVQPWPRAAMVAVVLLAVALAVTVAIAFTVARHTTTRTVLQPAPSLGQTLSCRFGRPC